MGSRSNLFLRTGETNASFQALTGSYPIFSAVNPDTMGAVGRDYFVELINEAIAVYAKTNGQLLQTTDLWSFFGTTNFPTLTDTRILYDAVNERWIASIINISSNDILLAVSKNGSPMDLVANWDKYRIQIGQANTRLDYDTMGMDLNGIYLSAVHLGNLGVAPTNAGFTLAAIKKGDVYIGRTNYTILTDTNSGLLSWAIQPAVNFDAVASNGYAWFVAKGPPTLGTNYKGGAVFYRRLQWSGSTAAWVEPNWISVPSTSYQAYYDFDGTNSIYEPVPGIGAPQAGGTNRISLGYVGSRLMMATIRNGYLWTCQHVGLSGSSGYYTGDQSVSTVDRSAAQWINFQVATTNLTYNSSERIFDPSSSNPFWYHFPSLGVNCNGDMAMGYSGSSNTNFIGAYYSWLFSGNSSSTMPYLIQAGTVNFSDGIQWGDYSSTSIDPADDWSIWTIQEYATPTANYSWATWVIEVNRDP